MGRSERKLKFRPSVDIFRDLMKEIESRKDTPELPTGLTALDEMIWGLWRKELLIVAGRPSHGKTSLTCAIAWNLAKMGKASTYVTLEMSETQLMERIFCSEEEVSGIALRRGNMTSDHEIRKKRFDDRIMNSPITIIDGYGYKFNEIEEIAYELRPSVLFIDHVQMISCRGYNQKHEAISHYVRTLKEISITQNIAIVLSSQFNRSGSDGGGLEFLKGSGELEECSDTVLGCYWEAKEKEVEDEKKYDIAILKQRHGPTGKVAVNFEGQYYRFTNRSQGGEV